MKSGSVEFTGLGRNKGLWKNTGLFKAIPVNGRKHGFILQTESSYSSR